MLEEGKFKGKKTTTRSGSNGKWGGVIANNQRKEAIKFQFN